MTSGEPSSGPSKTKLTGYALIGVGALAAVVGVASLAAGGRTEDSAQQVPPQPVAPPPISSPVQEPPADSGTGQAEPPAQQPSGVAQPPAPSTGDGGLVPQNPGVPTGAGQGSARIVVRVYNNSTITGLAHRAAEDFRQVGYEVPEVGNYPGGLIPTTTIYFRPGTPEQAQAEEVAAHFGARAEARFPGIEDATPGLIAIITNDYKGPAPVK